MAFEVKLQYNKSEKERLTKDLSDILTISGTLKDETSLIDPVVVIQCELSSVVTVNYMTIPVFGRSYFVKDVKSKRAGIVEFSCHVDVLSSFAEQIRANTGIIKKQEKFWNLYLNDGSLRVYQRPLVITKEFPFGFSTKEFVLAVAGS